MFVVLLGYFKVKPIMLSTGYHQIKPDLKYVCSEILPVLVSDSLIILRRPVFGFTNASSN
ncbi:hypothetical protein SAMN05421686_1302 [Thalassolituus maritimus]|uniref:Uncharacterized protein n=1 Tax=Thalassolituus maritimus TaxID=484498 RepID=A0A1N7QE85_9GAMM|nr:hypothetical protein SAMN05421686_1302 [Thalassolituus maritimus]